MPSLWKRGGNSCRDTFAWWWTNWSRHCQSSQLARPKRPCCLCCLSVCKCMFDIASLQVCDCVSEKEMQREAQGSYCVCERCDVICLIAESSENCCYFTIKTFKLIYSTTQIPFYIHTTLQKLIIDGQFSQIILIQQDVKPCGSTKVVVLRSEPERFIITKIPVFYTHAHLNIRCICWHTCTRS